MPNTPVVRQHVRLDGLTVSETHGLTALKQVVGSDGALLLVVVTFEESNCLQHPSVQGSVKRPGG